MKLRSIRVIGVIFLLLCAAQICSVVFCDSLLLRADDVTANDVKEAPKPKKYRLAGVDLKQTLIWDYQCLEPKGSGLAFGGQDQTSADGRGHTRILVDGKWKAIDNQLRAKNPLQKYHDELWVLRNRIKNILARMRFIYFKGYSKEKEIAQLKDVKAEACNILKDSNKLFLRLKELKTDNECSVQIQYAMRCCDLFIIEDERELEQLYELASKKVLKADDLESHLEPLTAIEQAAEALAAEPPARALNCGNKRGSKEKSQAAAIVYDKKTKLYVLFGGDHLDYLTNDTWVFDPAKLKWSLRHPKSAPPPRANHRMVANGDGTITMTGGYTYTSNVEYLGAQYIDLADGIWKYDITKNNWSRDKKSGKKQPYRNRPNERVYRTGPLHPDYYLQGKKPNAAAFQAWLAKIPSNQWVATNPLYRPKLNRDWGCARIDPHRDMMLRWSGGHSAHGGTDVPHFHFATNRWELPFPVEFPLGQLYSNTSYPNGYNFNKRPWVTGHTYQNYAYDIPSRKMIKAGRPNHFYIYDPDVGDWIGRGKKPKAMTYNSCFYTLTLTSTPTGVICWDRNGKVHQYVAAEKKWKALKLTGDKLPGAVVDYSTITYDSKRNRVLTFAAPGYAKKYIGVIYSIDLSTNKVTKLTPQAAKLAEKFHYIDRCVYDPQNDLVLIASFLNDGSKHTPTPAYDCANNRWVTLDLKYKLGKRYNRTTRAFPHGRSCGIVYDAKRKLIWGTDTNSQVYVLRLDLKKNPAKLLR